MQPYKSDVDDGEWSAGSSPPSYIQRPPEFAKLILASLFVALAVHAYLAARRDRIKRLESSGPGVNGRVGAIGSGNLGSGVGDPMGGNEGDSIGGEGGQLLGAGGSSAEPEKGGDDTIGKRRRRRRRRRGTTWPIEITTC